MPVEKPIPVVDPLATPQPLFKYESSPAFLMAQPIDAELFIRQTFADKPEKGYELLFKRYYRPLCSHAARFVYARDVAEDIVMDVFTQFWHKRLDRVVTTSYRAYLFTLVRHRAFAHLKAEFGRETTADTLPEPTPDESLLTPVQLLQFNELSLTIDATIRAAPPQSQKVFVMSRFDGKRNSDIAEELNLSIRTVEGHISRVLVLLKQALRNSDLLLIGLWLCIGLRA